MRCSISSNVITLLPSRSATSSFQSARYFPWCSRRRVTSAAGACCSVVLDEAELSESRLVPEARSSRSDPDQTTIRQPGRSTSCDANFCVLSTSEPSPSSTMTPSEHARSCRLMRSPLMCLRVLQLDSTSNPTTGSGSTSPGIGNGGVHSQTTSIRPPGTGYSITGTNPSFRPCSTSVAIA